MSPASFRHYGIAYGAGVAGNLRRRPYLASALPLMLGRLRAGGAAGVRGRGSRPCALASVGRSSRWRRASRSSCRCGGRTSSSRVVLPALARRVLRRARLVIAPSTALADEARRLGATRRADDPERRRPAGGGGRGGRSAGDLVRGAAFAREGRPRAGRRGGRACRSSSSGTARCATRFPARSGFSRTKSSSGCYEQAAVVACPSHREGFGVVCAEAMAYGRPVVAGDVGGLRDLVVHEETGLLVPPGDVGALRDALERLLGRSAISAGATARRAARGSPSTSRGSASRTKPCGPTRTRWTRLEGQCSR